ncbi:MAG: phosphoribosylformylglycinamidine synthase subunit PurS [Bacteroidia bacterium]
MPHYRVLLTVLPRPELLDPEGETIGQAIRKLGVPAVYGVRAGRAFELRLEAPSAEAAQQTAKMLAERLLHNPIVEIYQLQALEEITPSVH